MKTPLLLFGAVLIALAAVAQPAGSPWESPDDVWEPRNRGIAQAHSTGEFRNFALHHDRLRQILRRAPQEFTAEARHAPVLSLPLPNGAFARFRIVESPIMAPELAAKFPQFRTYAGQGVDDPAMTVRLAEMPDGLHAHIRSPRGLVQVRPEDRNDPVAHIVYDMRDVAGVFQPFECRTEPPAGAADALPEAGVRAASSLESVLPSAGSQLRVFRLAMAVTGEYTQRRGGTVADGLAAVLHTVNRLNGIFEAEAAIRLVLVANNDRLIYTNPDTDPYNYDLNNFSGRSVARGQNQANIDAVIGPTAYDIGHLLDTGGGGEALIGAVCMNGSKASAVSGVPGPTAVDDYWVYGVIPHEMGHQLGATHSWNGLNSGCSVDQYTGSTAYEPGSGSSIMSYSLSCGSDNLLVTNYYADAYYHSASFDQINARASSNCRVELPTGNSPPMVSAGGNFAIPAQTPFMLTATGSDPDGDAVTYSWEERDLGPRQAITGPGSEDNGSSPLFRSYPAGFDPSRTFPRLTDLLRNANSIGEKLPSRDRTLRFRVTARDHRVGGGGRSASDMQVTVVSNAGPFVVTFPNSAGNFAGTLEVTWDVARTTEAPINATHVNILLSTNGGLDFPITLAASTPNDGTESVNLPDRYIREARLKVEAVGNIFFDLSNTNFTVLPVSPWILAAGASVVNEGCPPGNGAVDPAETVTVAFVLENVGATAATALTVSLLPLSGVLAPGMAQAVATLPAGGRSTNAFIFTADSALACGGILNARLRVEGNTTAVGDLEFPLHLGELQTNTSVHRNTNTIVHQLEAARPYPSAIMVSNLVGVISKITVTLSNITHPSLPNHSVMLVGPLGQAVYLSYGAFLGSATNLTLEFDDDAPLFLYELNTAVSGRFKPTAIEPALMFPMPLPAPPEPNARGLSAFIGTQPNGLWRLFVSSLIVASNQIANGWAISITTSNSTCCHPSGLSLWASDAPDPVIVGSNLTYTFTVTNAEATTAADVIFSNTLPASVEIVSVNPSQGSCALDNGVITCALGALASNGSATVTVAVTPMVAGTVTNAASVNVLGLGAGPVENIVTILTTVIPAPVTIFITDAEVTEGNVGTRAAAFNVTLSRTSDDIVSVGYFTTNITAERAVDYGTKSGMLTFPRGATSSPVVVTVSGDLVPEPDEAFGVQLFNPTNALLAPRSQGVGTILNDDGLPGRVNHFVWSAMEATQFVNLSFAGTVTARDAANQPVASFSGPVSLAAFGASQEATIGTPNVGAWVLPMQAANHDARVQSIYLAQELGPAARLTALALEVTVVPGVTLSNWTIRLKHTTQTNYPVAAWEDTGWTIVHQTNLSVAAIGWLTFPFSAPFEYNGSNHLMIDFSFNNMATGTSGQCRYRNPTGPMRSLFGQANSTFGDPLAWAGTNAPVPGTTFRIPLLRLAVNPVMTIFPSSSGPFAGGVWNGELLVPQSATSLVLRADDGNGHQGVSGAFAVLSPPDSDGDALPDPWELRYFGSINEPNGDPGSDADQDGAGNRAEYLAGTNPTNAASRLHLTAELAGTDVRLRFTAQVGRNYRLERAASLAQTILWEPMPGATNIPGAGLPVQVIDSAAQAQRFYRVTVP